MLTRRLLVLFVAVVGLFASEAQAVYDAGTGRWLQRDPVGYVDGTSLYQYVRSSPVRYVDPYGLKIVIRTPNGARKETIRDLRSQLESALQTLCPSASLNRPNPRNPTFPGNKVKCEKGDPDPDDPCDDPPACRILQRLIDSPTTYPLYIRPDRVPKFHWDGPGHTPITSWPGEEGDGVPDNFAPWESLWHELLHLSHFDEGIWPYGYEPGRNGIPKDGPRPEFPLEELLTIDEMNELRDWYNACGRKNGNPPVDHRDPFSHPWTEDLDPRRYTPRPWERNPIPGYTPITNP